VLTRPEERQEEEVAEDKTRFFNSMKGPEAARKYMCQFVTKDNITVMCNRFENKLHRLSTQGKKKED
jgi:hypothetical protein